MTWRAKSWQVICQVQRDHPAATGDALRALLRDAYPFGMRQYWPYKVWLQCVQQACPSRQDQPLTDLPLFE